jgi:hypothetical protein
MRSRPCYEPPQRESKRKQRNRTPAAGIRAYIPHQRHMCGACKGGETASTLPPIPTLPATKTGKSAERRSTPLRRGLVDRCKSIDGPFFGRRKGNSHRDGLKAAFSPRALVPGRGPCEKHDESNAAVADLHFVERGANHLVRRRRWLVEHACSCGPSGHTEPANSSSGSGGDPAGGALTTVR